MGLQNQHTAGILEAGLDEAGRGCLAGPEETEELRVRLVSLAEAYAMVERREIRDSLTVAAIYKLRVLELEGKIQ